MIGSEDAPHTFEYASHYKILPALHGWSADPARNDGGVKVNEGLTYTSDANTAWMQVEELQSWIQANRSRLKTI